MGRCVMPWGKYRGRAVVSLPSSYLAWVIESCDNVPLYLRHAIRDVLGKRFGVTVTQYVEPESCSTCEELRALLGPLFRQLALACHPDRGGSNRAMAMVNEAREKVEGIVEV